MQGGSCHRLWLHCVVLVVAAAWAGWGDPTLYDPHPFEILCDLKAVVYGSLELRKGSLLGNVSPEPDVLHTQE